MNIFEFRFRLDNKTYDVYIDSSNNDQKKIVINNFEVINEKYTLSLNKFAYIIYYPIKIGEDELIISIDDNSLEHIYNVYLNNESLLDGSRIDKNYTESCLKINRGFKNFVKENWLDILKENLASIVSSILGCIILLNFTLSELVLKTALAFVIIPIFLPVFILIEWKHHKNIVKKYESCFRPSVQL